MDFLVHNWKILLCIIVRKIFSEKEHKNLFVYVFKILFVFSVCLSTVDRRSRERFIESNHQIAALVEKFKIEGHTIIQSSGHEPHRMINPNKMQISYGKPSELRVVWLLYM